MNPNPNIDCSGAPVVTLAGREWFVPVLAMRQARVVVPALMRLMPVLRDMQSGEPAAMARLSSDDYDAIIAVVHAALTRAYPELSREAFLDLPASTPELVAALGVVTRQTGFFKPADAAEEALGENSGGDDAPRAAPAFLRPVARPLLPMFRRALGRRAGGEPHLPAAVRPPGLLARVPADACAGAGDRGGAGVFKPAAPPQDSNAMLRAMFPEGRI